MRKILEALIDHTDEFDDLSIVHKDGKLNVSLGRNGNYCPFIVDDIENVDIFYIRPALQALNKK